jgi:malonate transporter MadL subunit
MTIYGVALLALCYTAGQLLGDWLGQLLGIDANVGGVGFAMLLLIFVQSWAQKLKINNPATEAGISFWSQMYLPIIIAMAATQNVKAALSSGIVAVLAGAIPVGISFLAIPFLDKLFTKNQETK